MKKNERGEMKMYISTFWKHKSECIHGGLSLMEISKGAAHWTQPLRHLAEQTKYMHCKIIETRYREYSLMNKIKKGNCYEVRRATLRFIIRILQDWTDAKSSFSVRESASAKLQCRDITNRHARWHDSLLEIWIQHGVWEKTKVEYESKGYLQQDTTSF